MPIALTTAIAWLRTTRWAQYALLGIAVVIAIVLAIRAYNASVIDDYEQERTARSVKSLDMSAEERAADAVNAALAEERRRRAIAEAAAKPEAAGATLAPQIVAFNCAAMREDYTAGQLARMREYQERCR